MRKQAKDDPKSKCIEIDKTELLVGDIIKLREYMTIPADCVLL